MRKLLYIIITSFVLCNISCKKETEQLPLFDFGSETFDEPFVGILSSRPEILLKSLEYPPFSWLMSDTVTFTKDLEIEFNEDCIRSKSEASLHLTDTLYRSLGEISILYSSLTSTNKTLEINADSLVKQCQIKISIPPSIGDTTLTGYVLLKGSQLDIANDVDLQNTDNIIATWHCYHHIGWPVTIWGLWLLILLTILLTVVFLLYVVYNILSTLLYVVYNILSTISMVIMRGKEGVCKMSFGEILRIKFKTGWSNEAIKWIENKDIENIYMNLDLKETVVGNRRALIYQKIDGNMIDKGTSDKHTNKVTMSRGGQPIIIYKGVDNSIELHHSGQDPQSLLVELPYSVHKEHFKTLHTNLKCSKINRTEFSTIKKNYWKARSKMF